MNFFDPLQMLTTIFRFQDEGVGWGSERSGVIVVRMGGGRLALFRRRRK